MWYKAEWIGHRMRLKLTRENLLVLAYKQTIIPPGVPNCHTKSCSLKIWMQIRRILPASIFSQIFSYLIKLFFCR